MMLARISRTMAMRPSQTTSRVMGSTVCPTPIESAAAGAPGASPACGLALSMARSLHQELAVRHRARRPARRNDRGRAALLDHRGADDDLVQHEAVARINGAGMEAATEMNVARPAPCVGSRRRGRQQR